MTIAERYLLTGKTDYNFSQRTYMFGAIRYDDDRFSGFEYQASLTTGVGWHIVDREKTKFDLEIGAGYKESKEDLTGMINEETIARFGENFTTPVSETTSFYQDLLIEAGDQQTLTEASTGIKVAVNSKLALKLSYNIKHTSNPLDMRDDTDQTTTINLVYGF